MHLILTGATGLVGSGVLHHMINAPTINKVSVLSRRPVPQAEGHEKVKVIIHKDFSTYPADILAQLKDADGVVWAQGISQTKVNKDEYLRITYDYPLAFARAISSTTSPRPFNFVYVSGEGATLTPSFYTPLFGTTKGRAEAALLALSKDPQFSNLRPFSVRPAGVDPAAHTEIHQFLAAKSGLEKVLLDGMLLPAMRAVAKGQLSPTRELGVVLSDLAAGDGKPVEGSGISGEGRTLSNVAVRRIGG